MENVRLLKDEEAAAIVGSTKMSIRLSRCTGILLGVPAPAYLKIGKSVRYRSTDLQAWISQFAPQSNTSKETTEKGK